MRLPVLIAAVYVSLGTWACGGRDKTDVDTSTVPFDTGVAARPTLGGDTALSGSPAPATPAAPATGDAKALGAFIAASEHEIQHGRLATDKASAQAVRDLGRSVARDHDDLVQRARELAKKYTVTPGAVASDTSIGGHRGVMSELRTKSGAAFDRVFLAHEVDYHRWLLDKVNTTMMPDATNEEVKTFLQQSIAIFQAHLKGAQDLLAKLPGG